MKSKAKQSNDQKTVGFSLRLTHAELDAIRKHVATLGEFAPTVTRFMYVSLCKAANLTPRQRGDRD